MWGTGGVEAVRRSQGLWAERAGFPGLVLKRGGCCQSEPKDHWVTDSRGIPRVISTEMRIRMQAALSRKDGRHTLPFSSLSAFRNPSLKKHLPRFHMEGFCEITHSLTHYSLLSPSVDSGTRPRDHLSKLSSLLKCWPDCPLDCELLVGSPLTPRTDTMDTLGTLSMNVWWLRVYFELNLLEDTELNIH